MSRIQFKPDPKAPKPYDYRALQRFMKKESARFSAKIAKAISCHSPWLDLLFTGGTF